MLNTVKLGYNEQLGAAKFVRYNREFIITGAFYGIILCLGTEKFVHYNREFVITEFVIAEFDCISFEVYCFVVLKTSIYEEDNLNKQKIKIGGLPKYTHF
jgi:hypothetical protein